MGKTVIVVDLNPLSRSSKMASITIVDEISRVAKNMLSMIENKELLTEKINFDNSDSVKNSVEFITKSLAEKFNLLT